MVSSTLSNPYVLIGLFYIAFLGFKVLKKINQPPSPLDVLQGPPRESFIGGNAGLKGSHGPGEYYLSLVKKYGRAVLFPGAGGSNYLFLADPKAMISIMNQSDTFGSNDLKKAMVLFMTGDSLLGQFGAVHRRQRRTISPAFHSSHLKGLYPTFMKLATRLGDTIATDIKKGGDAIFSSEASQDGSAIVNIYNFMNCAALDVIGEAGFGYHFEALSKGAHHDPIAKSFHEIVEAWSGPVDLGFILLMLFATQVYLPACSWPIIPRNIAAHKHNKVMRSVSRRLIEEKTQEIKDEMRAEGLENGKAGVSELFEGKKDILHLLLRANLAPGLSEKEKMSDEEVVEQLPLLLTAGFETSAVTSTWLVYYLAHNQEFQDELREYILLNESVLREDPESEEQKLITNLVLETVRMKPPVFESERTAFKDTRVPLFTPVIGRNGEEIHSVMIPKGTNVELGLGQANLDPLLYGGDAEEWNPKRWDNLPEAHGLAKLPPWGLFSFLAGPKSCIGSHFAMSEIRSFVIDIVPRFRFEPSQFTIVPKHALVQKPYVVEKKEIAMPIKVTPIVRD